MYADRLHNFRTPRSANMPTRSRGAGSKIVALFQICFRYAWNIIYRWNASIFGFFVVSIKSIKSFWSRFLNRWRFNTICPLKSTPEYLTHSLWSTNRYVSSLRSLLLINQPFCLLIEFRSEVWSNRGTLWRISAIIGSIIEFTVKAWHKFKYVVGD